MLSSHGPLLLGFQFLLGRLETLTATPPDAKFIPFQFLLGRLETKARPPKGLQQMCFNSS